MCHRTYIAVELDCIANYDAIPLIADPGTVVGPGINECMQTILPVWPVISRLTYKAELCQGILLLQNILKASKKKKKKTRHDCALCKGTS